MRSPHGRVPKLENDLVLERAERLEVHKRVVSLELWRTQYKAYGVIVIAVSGLVSSRSSSIIAGLALMMLKSYSKVEALMANIKGSQLISVLKLEDAGMSGVVTKAPGDRGGLTRFGTAKWHPRAGEAGLLRDEPG